MSWNNQIGYANWSGNPKTTTNTLKVSSIFTNYISSGTIATSNLLVSSINGSGVSNYNVSRWAYYPALTNVQMNYHDIQSAGNIRMKGNFTMDGTGNTVSPYWYNADLTANITCGNSSYLYNPYVSLYTSNFSVSNVNVDLNTGIYSYPNASVKLYPATVLPVGNAVLNAKNFNLTNPLVTSYALGNYRGYAGVVCDGGDGTSAYLKLNADILTSFVPNTAPLTYMNGDSYLGSITELGVSRIATTYGKIQNLGTFHNETVAGYVGTSGTYSPVCSLQQDAPGGGAGGGTTLNLVDAGYFGARNDMISKNSYARGGGGITGVVMEIGSRGTMNIYSGSNLEIGLNTNKYFTDTQGAVNLYNVSTINGLPFSNYSPANWWSFPAGGDVNMAGNNISSINSIYVSNIFGNNGANIEVKNNMDLDTSVLYAGGLVTPYLYVVNLTNLTPDPINVLNSLDLSGNNIMNVNNISTLNVLTNGVSTNTIAMYSDIDKDPTIYFSDLSNNICSVIGVNINSGDALMNIVNTSTIAIYSLEKEIVMTAKNQILIASGENDVVVSAVGNVLVNAENVATLNGIVTTNIVGGDTSITLGNEITLNGTIVANGNINMNSNAIYNINSISSLNISTGVIRTAEIYTQALGNQILYPPTPILVNNDLNMQLNNISNINITRSRYLSTINISSSVIRTGEIYTQALGNQILYPVTPILVNNDLNMQLNNISNVNNLYGKTLSTSALYVSSINAKQYPYTSTLNAPPSTFSYAASNTQSRTVPYVLYSNVAFPNPGWFNVSQKAIFTRASGTSDTHQSIFYTPGAFISTPSIKDGYAYLPYINQNNSSTFTTLTTELYISSTQLNRNITLYNDTTNNFVGNLFLDRLVATYNPSRGLNPE